MVGAERQVMEPLSSGTEEAGQEPLAVRLQHLDPSPPRVFDLAPPPAAVASSGLLAAAEVSASQRVTVQAEGGLDLAQRYRHVMQAELRHWTSSLGTERAYPAGGGRVSSCRTSSRPLSR